ncbi:hypothetical protein [Staphylococcus pseudoxylosus]|uniref:hypothetical protein n=1 Tax=Staphylococcus pseudoxylosus TaxID=2282419 RepID=UPI002DBC901E|nr:hypothetical protein [Staphylococcus pseudoxylosus]MEB7752527.1 hypothetical protein [Staphylococcus pseudoxylosus]
MNLKQALKITLLIVILAEEIKSVKGENKKLRKKHGIRTILSENGNSKVEVF